LVVHGYAEHGDGDVLGTQTAYAKAMIEQYSMQLEEEEPDKKTASRRKKSGNDKTERAW
jgi:hypothetical protein